MGMGPTEGWSATATSHTSWALPLKMAKAAAWSLTQWSGAVPLSGIYNTTTQVRSRLWPSPWLDFASQQHPTSCPNMVCVPSFITNNSTGHVFQKLFSHHDCAAIYCTTLVWLSGNHRAWKSQQGERVVHTRPRPRSVQSLPRSWEVSKTVHAVLSDGSHTRNILLRDTQETVRTLHHLETERAFFISVMSLSRTSNSSQYGSHPTPYPYPPTLITSHP